MFFKKADITAMPTRYRANFINSLSGFKSANLIGTSNNRGQTNLSIVSSAFHIGAHPPLMGFIFRPDIAERHSLDNIRETSVFSVNQVSQTIYKQAHQTSARYPRDISEFDQVGLTPAYVEFSKAPYVLQAELSLLMRLREEIPLKINGTHMIIAEIEGVQLDENFIAVDGFVDIEAINTVAISGLDSYHSTQRLSREPYAKP